MTVDQTPDRDGGLTKVGDARSWVAASVADDAKGVTVDQPGAGTSPPAPAVVFDVDPTAPNIFDPNRVAPSPNRIRSADRGYQQSRILPDSRRFETSVGRHRPTVPQQVHHGRWQ
jgi:hypothetical protein